MIGDFLPQQCFKIGYYEHFSAGDSSLWNVSIKLSEHKRESGLED